MDANEQQIQLPLEERVNEGVEAAYTQHGYAIDGEINKSAVEDKVYTLVSTAVVDKRADRGKLAVTRRGLMSSTFGQVPGPEAWAEAEDPDLAARIYSRLDGHLWRLVAPDENGAIQSRLNGDSGLVLCRTKATPDKADAVYVTRDRQCMLADFSAPQKTHIQKAADRYAKNLAMAAERQPENAKLFGRELSSGMSTALGSSKAILTPAIEAATMTADEDASDPNGDE